MQECYVTGMPDSPQILITADGSPTLYQGNSVQNETMHSRFGAFSETQQVYGRSIALVKERQWAPSFFVLGLGLGYIEMAVVANFMKHGELQIDSYETDADLVDRLRKWLRAEPTPLDETYNAVLERSAVHYKVDTDGLKRRLRDLMQTENWRIHGDIRQAPLSVRKHSAILYDAYSEKTNADLWSCEFISRLLCDRARPQAAFSTYAAKGTLNRALKENGFELVKFKGFAIKRESTFAFRSQ